MKNVNYTLTDVLRKRETQLGSPSPHLALVVESDETQRMRMADALVTRGYIVHTSASAEAAAELTHQVAFGLMVIGPQTLGTEAPAVRALLRHEGVRQAVVFQHDSSSAPDVGIAPGVLIRLAPGEDAAAKLRALVAATGNSKPRHA